MLVRARRGRELEEEIFGVNISGQTSLGPQLNYTDSLRQCVRRQPPGWDPKRPPTKLGFSLRWHVWRFLPKGWRDELELRGAVGTPLDRHGVDGFLLLRRKRVTIDISHRRDKSYWADVLLTREDIERDRVIAMARLIAQYFRGRIDKKELRSRISAGLN